MPIQDQAFNPAAHHALGQFRALLEANNVPEPYILWIQGKALIPFMAKIGKTPYPKDGRIFHDQLYRYNLNTGRYRAVEPRG